MNEQTFKVLNYCDIPSEISEKDNRLNEAGCDVYVGFIPIPKNLQHRFSSNFDLDNWIIDNYPETEGYKILIYMNY